MPRFADRDDFRQQTEKWLTEIEMGAAHLRGLVAEMPDMPHARMLTVRDMCGQAGILAAAARNLERLFWLAESKDTRSLSGRDGG